MGSPRQCLKYVFSTSLNSKTLTASTMTQRRKKERLLAYTEHSTISEESPFPQPLYRKQVNIECFSKHPLHNLLFLFLIRVPQRSLFLAEEPSALTGEYGKKAKKTYQVGLIYTGTTTGSHFCSRYEKVHLN